MPYGGQPWSRVLGFSAAALGSMFLGSQCVHAIYRPLDNLDEVVEKIRKEKQADYEASIRLKKEREEEIHKQQ